MLLCRRPFLSAAARPLSITLELFVWCPRCMPQKYWESEPVNDPLKNAILAACEKPHLDGLRDPGDAVV